VLVLRRSDEGLVRFLQRFGVRDQRFLQKVLLARSEPEGEEHFVARRIETLYLAAVPIRSLSCLLLVPATHHGHVLLELQRLRSGTHSR